MLNVFQAGKDRLQADLDGELYEEYATLCADYALTGTHIFHIDAACIL